MLDLRRRLFKLEQFSPYLARKIWGLTPLLSAPFSIALGLKVSKLDDSSVEIEIPATLQNKDENGKLSVAALAAGAEFAGKLLWRRFLQPLSEELFLENFELGCLKATSDAVKVRTQMTESDRELVLRQLRSGSHVTHEMAVLITDNKNQTVAQVNLKWKLIPKVMALNSGSVK